ncbi:Transposase [Roseovarius pacificus]|uniref:Transposase n=1 Tax=Roseovarius pacificus TaxID=337701 RepID=A0A1M7AI60_9RHOB|nr:transposase [Roseovarius pacificus]GGO53432.1 hypothetical protein GCM10011315_11220 [Roseovarius pacificus]SHL42296.1 Transposase [Roseovarius pacificus]
MPGTRNPYPTEFREQMVALVRTGRSVESLAREYEPCAATIHEWVRQAASRRALGWAMGTRQRAHPVIDAICKSLLAPLDCELPERRKFKTKVEDRIACVEFIEDWYTPSRRHSALGYTSPINHERTAAEGLDSPSP